jgi:hypothetical protein
MHLSHVLQHSCQLLTLGPCLRLLLLLLLLPLLLERTQLLHLACQLPNALQLLLS